MIDSYKTGNKYMPTVIVNVCAVPEEKGKILKISFILSIIFIIVVLVASTIKFATGSGNRAEYL